jgi:hypothetical protein
VRRFANARLTPLVRPHVNTNWPFDQEPLTATVTSRQVIEGGLPILQAVHYSDDGSWAFTCGTTNNSADLLLVALKNLVALDPTICQIAKLPIGWSATRQFVGGPWSSSADPAA